MAPSRLATPVFSARRVPGFLRANVDDRRVVEAAEESLDTADGGHPGAHRGAGAGAGVDEREELEQR